MFINLINNIAFLIALVMAGQIVIDRFPQKTLTRQVLLGSLFGGVALLGMANPVNFLPGVFFDGRSIVLVVAGVVGGGFTAAIAAGMAAVYRYQLGGSGAVVGIMVVLLPALLGVLARQWWLKRTQPPRLIDYLALGVVVQFIQLAAFTQIPNRAGYAFIEQAWWVLLLFYPLATMLLCQFFRNHEQRLIDKEALQSAQDTVIAQERTSMQRFHAYFDHSIVGLAITSLDKGWIEVNDALCATLGYTREELVRMTWAELTYPGDLAADRAQFDRMLAGEINGYTLDTRFIHKKGHLVDTRLAISHVCKPDGSLDYVVAMVEDVSDYRKAEKDYREMFSEMLDAFALHEIVCNAQGEPVDYRFLAVNPAFERITGLRAADIVGHTVLDVLPGTEKYWIETFGKVALTGSPASFERYAATFNKHFEVKAFRPSAGRFISIFGDITERKRSEDALRRMVKDLGQTQRIAHIGSWYLDVASNQVVWTEELYKMYGFDPSNPIPPYTEHMKLFTPESWEKLSLALARTKETGVAYTLELETARKDGSNGWMWVHGEAEVDAEGKTVGLWGAAQDITGRKSAEENIRLAEARFRTIIEVSPIPFALNDSALNITYLNSAFIQTFGYKQTDIPTVEAWWPKAYPDEMYRHEVAKEWTLRIDAAQRDAKPFVPMEVKLRCKDGSERIVLATATPLTSSFNDLHVVTLYDITERKRAQEAALEALTRVDRLAQHVPGMLYQYHLRPDGTSHFPYTSAGIKEIYGVLPEQVSQDAQAVFKVIHPDDLQQVSESIQASARTLSDWHAQYRLNLPDGRTIWVEGESSPEAAPDGGVLWHGHIRDITERKKTESLLHEQLDELQRWQQTMLGREGRIISMKQEVNELLARFGQPPRYADQLRADHAAGGGQPLAEPGKSDA